MTFPNTRFQRWLRLNHACTEGRAWVGSRTSAEAWHALNSPEWLMWLATRLNAPQWGLRDAIRECEKIAGTRHEETVDALGLGEVGWIDLPNRAFDGSRAMKVEMCRAIRDIIVMDKPRRVRRKS